MWTLQTAFENLIQVSDYLVLFSKRKMKNNIANSKLKYPAHFPNANIL